MADTTKQEYVLWPYRPSVAGGAIAAIAFALLTCAHVFRLVKNRTWFCIPFVIGALVCNKPVILNDTLTLSQVRDHRLCCTRSRT